MNSRNLIVVAGIGVLGIGIAAALEVVPVLAQQAPQPSDPSQVDPNVEAAPVQEVPAGRANVLEAGAARSAASAIAQRVAPRARWRESVSCTLDRASEVQRYAIECQNATRLNAQIADCCIAGDHWEIKAKVWDVRPNTAVTTAPGGANVFGVPLRVFNYGGTPENPRHLYGEVDCSFLHGVDLFPASSTVVLTSDGSCTVRDLGKRDEINRTP